MKSMRLALVSTMILIGLSGCSGKPVDNLNDSIAEYKKCLINNDFKCQVEFLDKVAMEEMTGMKVDEDALVKELKRSGVKMTNVEMNKPSTIVENGKTLSSTITFSAIMEMQGQKIKHNASLKAISRDNGSTWFFTQDY